MRAMVYDTENRLTCVVDPSGGLCTTGGATVYAYDPDGQRVAKTTGTGTLVEEYVYDFSGNQVSAHNSTSTLRNELYAPNGRHVATYGSSILTYNFADWLGTERVRFNSNGTVSFTDMPYGMNLAGTGGDTSPMHFTGKPRDTETGLDYFGARFNSSNLGRFMTPDWAEKPEVVPYSDLEDPQTLNLYGYVRNNPLSKADADGHDWNDSLEFGIGLVRGVAASVSFGYVGAPRSSDTTASLTGQMMGSVAVAHIGASTATASGPTALAGLAGAPETGGGSLAVSAVAVVAGAAGTAAAAGATKNGVAVVAMALAKQPTGKGSVPKEDRDPKRTLTNNEKAEKLASQDGKCAHCGQAVEGEKGEAHHDPVRHADGGTEIKVVHEACHKGLHCGS
jgi:RHS repeat-associated protein